MVRLGCLQDGGTLPVGFADDSKPLVASVTHMDLLARYIRSPAQLNQIKSEAGKQCSRRVEVKPGYEFKLDLSFGHDSHGNSCANVYLNTLVKSSPPR